LTGDEAYLDSWRSATSDLERYALVVRSATSDNPNQQMQLQTVDRLIAQRIHAAEGIIALRRAQGLDIAAEALQTGETQRILQDFQQILQTMHTRKPDY